MSSKIINGFMLKQEEFLVDINSNIQIFEHIKTGANLIYIDNKEENKTFTIGFKTPPKDSTGVMHILEHSVLCGSKNFPVKEPFVELCKGSLNTFLNAMTYSDKTVYPVSSRNEKDLYNLMNVYLDAVFYPNIYKNENIFKQEGWHYHIENEEDEIYYNGVVYNEMKGVYSSPMNLLFRKIEETLYPNTPYGNDSGGNPKYIPNLTYEDFLNTHKELYHPSNSYIALSGNLNLENALDFIDKNYLSNFSRMELNVEIPKEMPFREMVEHNVKYSVLDESKLVNEDYMALNISMGDIKDMELALALNILETMLMDTEEAPLRQAIIDAKIGDDAFGVSYSEILQPYFSVIVKGTDKSKKEEFLNVIRTTLEDLVANGINKDLIKGCINIYEFAYREGSLDSLPKGLAQSIDAIGVWIHGVNPIEKLKFEKYFKNIKTALTEPYFENMIEKYILNNTHSSFIVLEPELNLSKKEEHELNDTLKEYKKNSSLDNIKRLIQETKALINHQSSKDSQEDLMSIPMLSLDDLDREAVDIKMDNYCINDINLSHFNIFTNGIAYLSLKFDTRTVKQEDIPYIQLLSSMLSRLDTKNRDYASISNEIMNSMGSLTFNNTQYLINNDINNYLPILNVSCKTLKDNVLKSLELIVEIINNTTFEDNKRIKEIIKENISAIEMSMLSRGDSIALGVMNSYYSPVHKYVQKLSGIEYYNFLKDIDANIENAIDELKSKLYEIKKLIFNINNLRIFIIGSHKEKDEVLSTVDYIKESIDNTNLTKNEYEFELRKSNEGYIIPSEVQYVAKGYNFKELGYEYNGSMDVLSNVLRYGYLWNKIRVQGGAYGSRIMISKTGLFNLCSYRDPNISETIKVYEELPSFVECIDLTDRELEKAIIGALGESQLPLTPCAIGGIAISNEISGITKEYRQKIKNEIFNTTVEDLKSNYRLIKDVMNKDCHVVVGNEKIKENPNLFGEIKNLIK